MKKLLLTLIALLGLATAASAQKAQLQLSYGGYTQMDATDMHDGGKVNTAWGNVTAGVYFDVAPKLKLGATYTFSSASYKYVDDLNVYYHVIMLNGRYDYYRNSLVKLYGHVGIGCDISHIALYDESENKGYFAFQLSPVGAEFDINRNISMFGELGFGAQGLLQVGFRFNL